MQRRRRAPALRARHKKRNPRPDPQFTGPITLTVIQTIRPTSSTVLSTPTPSPPPVTTSSSSSSITTSSTAITTITPPSDPATQVTPPGQSLPSVSVISRSSPPSTDESVAPIQAGALGASTRLPAGAIVGIVVGTILIMLAAVVVIVRSRFRKHRKTRRATWLARGGISSDGAAITGKTLSSFAPKERQVPDSTIPPMSTYPAYPSTLTRPGDTSPGITFARLQTNALTNVPAISSPAATFNNLPSGATYGPSPAGPTPGTTALTPRAILPVESAVVKFTFIPSLPDELSISNGQVIRVLQEFDDGWALCMNERGQQGMVPLECLDRSEGVASGLPRNWNRASSLNILPNRRYSGFQG